VTRQNSQMVEEASAATGVLDVQAQAVAKALEVFKLPPQGGSGNKASSGLKQVASGTREVALRADAPKARRA
jgi:aerotaxis receptor